MWCLSGNCFGSSGSCLVFVKPLVFLRGRRFCFCSCEPFTARPVFGGCMRPSSSSVRLVSSATFLSLSFFFLSGAGETQTPFGVWGSPCDSSTWPRTASSTRTSSSPHTSRSPPPPVFFFVRRRRSFSVRCFLVSCLVGVGGLGGCFLSLVLVLVGWLHCLCFLFWPRGAFFFLLGWWGSPCRVFSSPCFLVLGGWVGDFCILLHLASLSCS